MIRFVLLGPVRKNIEFAKLGYPIGDPNFGHENLAIKMKPSPTLRTSQTLRTG